MNNKLNFEKTNGLIPAIIQDAQTNKVLMLGYMNQEALTKTEQEQTVTFYSRTKQRLWTKGETSGNFLKVKEIIADCDGDTLLIKVNPVGEVCHTGSDTCFQETNKGKTAFLLYLQEIIHQRKVQPSPDSYTSKLFAKGVNKIAQKVGEEAVELVIEAKDNNADLFKNEAADLLFHYLILLEEKNVGFDEIIEILHQRHQ